MKNKKFPVIAVVLIWFVLALLAILNGAFRLYVIIPFTGEYAGHIISSIIFSAVVVAVAYVFIKTKKISDRKTQFQIGFVWLIITIVFEFIFGHYVMNHPWEKLLRDYNFLDGRVWIVVLIATFFAPVLAAKLVERFSTMGTEMNDKRSV